MALQNSGRNTFNGGVWYGRKFAFFGKCCRLSRKRYEMGSYTSWGQNFRLPVRRPGGPCLVTLQKLVALWYTMGPNDFGALATCPINCGVLCSTLKWLTKYSVSLPEVGYYAEFGRSRPNSLGVHRGSQTFWVLWAPPLGMERGWPQNTPHVGWHAEFDRSGSQGTSIRTNSTPRVPPLRSLEIIESDTGQSTTYDFLLVISDPERSNSACQPTC